MGEKRKVNFPITLECGKEVAVTWEPDFMNHLEFRGPVSETGYRSDFPFTHGEKVSLEKVKEVAKIRAEQLYLANPAKHGVTKKLL